MNKYTLNILIAVTSSALTLIATTTSNTKDTQILHLTAQVTELTTRLTVMNESITGLFNTNEIQLNSISLNTSTDKNHEQKAIWVPEISENKSLQNLINKTNTSLPTRNQQTRPGMVMITPSIEQNTTYEILKNQLEDPYYISTLSLNDLANSTELQTLPEVMQLSILSKAITRFNNGEVNKDTFMRLTE